MDEAILDILKLSSRYSYLPYLNPKSLPLEKNDLRILCKAIISELNSAQNDFENYLKKINENDSNQSSYPKSSNSLVKSTKYPTFCEFFKGLYGFIKNSLEMLPKIKKLEEQEREMQTKSCCLFFLSVLTNDELIKLFGFFISGEIDSDKLGSALCSGRKKGKKKNIVLKFLRNTKDFLEHFEFSIQNQKNYFRSDKLKQDGKNPSNNPFLAFSDVSLEEITWEVFNSEVRVNDVCTYIREDKSFDIVKLEDEFPEIRKMKWEVFYDQFILKYTKFEMEEEIEVLEEGNAKTPTLHNEKLYLMELIKHASKIADSLLAQKKYTELQEISPENEKTELPVQEKSPEIQKLPDTGDKVPEAVSEEVPVQKPKGNQGRKRKISSVDGAQITNQPKKRSSKPKSSKEIEIKANSENVHSNTMDEILSSPVFDHSMGDLSLTEELERHLSEIYSASDTFSSNFNVSKDVLLSHNSGSSFPVFESMQGF